MRVIWLLAAILAVGCDDGGSGGSDGGPMGEGGGSGDPPAPIEGGADTLALTAAVDGMRRIAEGEGVAKANLGDPAAYLMSEATTPTDMTVIASVYYETAGLVDAVGRARDRRPGVTQDDDAGAKIQNRVASALTIGWASDTPSGRGGPRWHAVSAALALDHYLLLGVHRGLSERSAAGFDRALGVLWDASGAPHGLGALIARADAYCGTAALDEIAGILAEVRAPFMVELEASGLPDALGRLTIEAGALPAYDAAIESVTRLTAEAMQRLMAAELVETDFDAGRQARALARNFMVQPWLAASGVPDADRLGALLDAASPGEVDLDAVRAVLTAAGTPCAR